MSQSVRADSLTSLWRSMWLRAIVLGVVFFALGRFAGWFAFPPQTGAVLWLPSGLSLAFLLRSSPRCWPALLTAIFLAELSSVLLLDFTFWVAASWALGNFLRTLLGAWLMRRFVGTSIRLSHRWEVAGLFLFGGILGPLPSATMGALTTVYGLGATSLVTEWWTWWLSDALGTVLIAPLLLTWTSDALRPKRAYRLLELGGILALTALVTHLIFGLPPFGGVLASLAYAIFPLALWGALRMGSLGAATTSAVLATVALWHTTLGRGPFGMLAALPEEKALILQVFLAILSLSALTLGAVASERQRTEQLQFLQLEVGTVLAASLDLRETLPRVARLIVPRAWAGFALWLIGEHKLLERVAQAGWDAAREARVRGHLPPLPTTARRWSTSEGTVVLVPIRVQGSVQGAVVLMSDERVQYARAGDVALAEDLAYRCGMALENARLYAEAREAVEARNEFIAIAGHELRTPLTALTLRMRSLEALLRQEGISAGALEKFRSTSRQLARLSELVERLLDVGRITTGLLELHRERVDVSRLVEQVVESFAEEAARAGSALRVEVQPGLTAWWDRGRVEQALTNLLANALKFGAGNPIELQASLRGERVSVSVRDHGIGIAPEALERIFERFERAVSARQYGGLGLGLFLTRQIAESHEGTIRVENHPGAGAAFVLELPVDPRSSLAKAPESPGAGVMPAAR
jgi:signal transduction histidine kinase